MNNKIAILLATFNGEKYIKGQIESILNQTSKNWLLFIHDDGSLDTTVNILKEYDLRYIDSNETLGANKSFAKLLEYALENSECEYFMFCDQDDIWEEDKIEKTLTKMKNLEHSYNDAPLLVHTDLTVVDNELHVLNKSFWDYEKIDPTINSFNRLLMQNTITGCTMMINRRLAELASPITCEAVMHDSWLGLVASYFGKIGVINEPTIQYRQHALNSVGTKGFGVLYILDKLSQENILLKNSIQAKAFLSKYKDSLNDNIIEMLEDFSTIESKSFWQKRKILLKYKLLKQGFIRNVGLLIKI